METVAKMFAEYAALSVSDIYGRFRDAALVSGLDREPSYREVALLPVEGQYARVGAALFLAILAYPDEDKKQDVVVRALAAQDTKARCPPKHPFRRELRNDPSTAALLDVPNKRIDQTLADAVKRINKRLRAAWVLWQKFSSNPDPAKQDQLQKWMRIAARQDTRDYRAFSSTHDDPEDRDEADLDSFRRQVMVESRPVIHATMAFYLWSESQPDKVIGLPDLVSHPDWLKPVIVAGEIFRLSFGDLFPRHDTQRDTERVQNYAAPLAKTIAFLPYPLPIDVGTDFFNIFHQQRNLSRIRHS